MRTYHNIYVTSIIIGIMMLVSCKNDMKNIIKISEIEQMPELSGENLHLIQTEFGTITLSVFTKTIQKYSSENSQHKSPQTIFPDGIHVVHFKNYPDTLSMIQANYAILYEEENKWEAKGNVIAKNSKGELLNTEFLIWDQSEGKIYSDELVQITTAEDIIIGHGFTSDDNFENWEVEKVTGVFTFNENENSNIDSLETNNDK